MSTAPRRPDLANEPVGRLMLRLSIPTITAQLVNMLYNLVDRIYISYIPDVGTLALTGLGVCLPIILLVSAFAALCASSGAPLASIAMGQRNNEKAEGILGSCTALLLCVSAVLTVVLSCFYTPILLAFGATEDALPYAQRYIAIYSLGTVFVQLSLGLNPFITAQGFSKAGMLTVLIGAVLNTLLDPLFIFVFHMDVQGAALATVISQAVSAAFVLRFLTGRQTILHLKRRLLRLNWKLLAPCVALGLAPFIMQSTESLVSVCFNTSLRAADGTLAVGTMTICSTLMQFALLPLQGLSQGAQPIISFNYGAKRPERVKAAFRILLISCLAFSAVLGLTCIFAPQIFVYLLTPDAALRAYAIPCVRLYMAGVTIFGAQIACQQTFVALGNAKCSLFLACLRKLILLIPLMMAEKQAAADIDRGRFAARVFIVVGTVWMSCAFWLIATNSVFDADVGMSHISTVTQMRTEGDSCHMDVVWDGRTLDFPVSRADFSAISAGDEVLVTEYDGFWGAPYYTWDYPDDATPSGAKTAESAEKTAGIPKKPCTFGRNGVQ